MPVRCFCFFTHYILLFLKTLPTSNRIHLVMQIWQLHGQYFRKITQILQLNDTVQFIWEPYKYRFLLSTSFIDRFGCEPLGQRSPEYISSFLKHLTSILLMLGIKKVNKIQFPFYILNLLNAGKKIDLLFDVT